MNKRKSIVQICTVLIVALYIAACVVTFRFQQISNDSQSVPLLGGVINIVIGLLFLLISKNQEDTKKRGRTKFLGYFFLFGMTTMMIIVFLGGYKLWI